MSASLPDRAPARPVVARPRRTVGRRGPLLAGCAVVCALVLAACGGADAKKASSTPDSQPVQGGAELAALWPLTGERVRGATPDRPVLVTKIDNTASSAPQLGLSKADLITEELVEGGLTRLAVFFYQQLPSVAGPVRSMRASDIGIVKPAHAVLVASGAAPPTLTRLRYADVPYFEEETGGRSYFRDSGRRKPYDLFARLPSLADKARSKAVVPASYLPWGTEKEWPGGRRATGLDARFSPDHTTSWSYAGGRYVNKNSFAAAGDRFNPDTVVVIRVREGDAGYLDPAGNKVPETLWTGSGPVLVLHRGQVVRGTWRKSGPASPVRFSTARGQLSIPAGHVWVELLPVDGAGGRVTLRP